MRQCRRKRADSSDIKCLQAATGMAVCHRYQKPPPMLKNYTTKLVWFKWRNNKAVQKKKKNRSEVVEIKRQPREPSRVPESDPVPEGEGGGWYHQQDASIKTSDTRGKL